MFNRRNFAQLVAGLIPLPFLKLPTLDLEVEEDENVENLPVIRFIESDKSGIFFPDNKQFEKELDELLNCSPEEKDIKQNYSYCNKKIAHWLEKKYAIRRGSHTGHRLSNSAFWGKVSVNLYIFGECEGGWIPLSIGFDIVSTADSKQLGTNVIGGYHKTLIDYNRPHLGVYKSY